MSYITVGAGLILIMADGNQGEQGDPEQLIADREMMVSHLDKLSWTGLHVAK